MNKEILESKKTLVEAIATKMKESASTVVCEYRGLTVAEVTELRRKLRAENVEFKVYKNSMVSRAAESADFGDLCEGLTGPNAIAFSSDAVAPARILADFAKTHKALVLKNGIVEGRVLDSANMAQIASIPGREGLISMFMSCLQAPLRNVCYAVNAVRDAKPEESAAPAAAAEEAKPEESAAEAAA